MPTTETKIWLALKSRIDTLPFNPKIPIAWPAATYDPKRAAFIAVGRVSVAPQRVFIGKGQHDRRGTLSLIYAAPIGQDIAVYDEIAGKIAAHFEEDTRMQYGGICVRVTAKPHVVDGYRDDTWWRTPVNITWTAAG